MTSKEQFCLSQMTKCLANPMPFQNMMMPPPPSQPSVEASEPEGVTVDPPFPPPLDGFEPFESVASGVNTGKITRMKKKPHSFNFGEPPSGSLRCNSQNFIVKLLFAIKVQLYEKVNLVLENARMLLQQSR